MQLLLRRLLLPKGGSCALPHSLFSSRLPPQVSPMHVWDADAKRIVLQPALTWVPGLYKIFDEILVNAADNKRRDARMNTLRVTVDAAAGCLSVWNNGACSRCRPPPSLCPRALLPQLRVRAAAATTAPLLPPPPPTHQPPRAQARASPSSSTASTTCGSPSSSLATC